MLGKGETQDMALPWACAMYLTSRCDLNCRHCLIRSPYPGDADPDAMMRNVIDFASLGGRYIDLTGGNPLLVEWLPYILQTCNKFGLYSSLTVCGSMVYQRAAEFMHLPSLLRFSVDGAREFHNVNRGKDCFGYIRQGLELARELRKGKKTQLIFTIIPGDHGNLNRTQLGSVLSLAREFQVMINVNPVFDIQEFRQQELADLTWFAKQADVQLALGKIRFVRRGGNNNQSPTCRAIRDVVTVAPDNFLVVPCYHHAIARVSLNGGLRKALGSSQRLNHIRQDGRFDFCQGCSIWCYIIPSLLRHALDRVVAWQNCLSGLQPVRDQILRVAGRLHPNCPYPRFHI